MRIHSTALFLTEPNFEVDFFRDRCVLENHKGCSSTKDHLSAAGEQWAISSSKGDWSSLNVRVAGSDPNHLPIRM